MNGKGDTPRPKSVPADEFARRWEKAFARPKGLRDAVVVLDLSAVEGAAGDLDSVEPPLGWNRAFARCTTCAGYGMIDYDRRERPIPCPDCPAGCGHPEPREAA